MKTLAPITDKQLELIRLIYRYRFLERKQIQTFLGHKSRSRITTWLKDLREKKYIEWIYDPNDPIESTKSAIYFLGLTGIRILSSLDDYPQDELRKRYSESSRKRSFVDRCLLLADCCIDMEACAANDGNLEYAPTTEADYLDPDNDYHFLAASEFIRPGLLYVKTESAGDDITQTTTLVEVLDATLPRGSLRKRLRDYVSFLECDEWAEGTGDDELPIIAFVCPTKAELIYAKRRVTQLLAEAYGDDEDDYPLSELIRFTTLGMIRKLGLTGRVWESLD